MGHVPRHASRRSEQPVRRRGPLCGPYPAELSGRLRPSGVCPPSTLVRRQWFDLDFSPCQQEVTRLENVPPPVRSLGGLIVVFVLGVVTDAAVQARTAAAGGVVARPGLSFSLADRAGRRFVDGAGQDLGGGAFRVVARLHRLIADGAYVLRIGLSGPGGRDGVSLVYDLTAKVR